MLYPALQSFIAILTGKFQNIPEKRLEVLKDLCDNIIGSLKKGEDAELIFICTHNSRRSQFAQAWAHAAVLYYGIDNINIYSGGTEATSFHPNAVSSIKRLGFSLLIKNWNQDNPIYAVKIGDADAGSIQFSKKYDDPPNPTSGFIAIMVCSEAEEACPVVPGAAKIISMPFEDPKVFDGTDSESDKYDERNEQIAVELFYLFMNVSQQVIQITGRK
jgi:arsenate reductase (thioredoxin)